MVGAFTVNADHLPSSTRATKLGDTQKSRSTSRMSMQPPEMRPARLATRHRVEPRA